MEFEVFNFVNRPGDLIILQIIDSSIFMDSTCALINN